MVDHQRSKTSTGICMIHPSCKQCNVLLHWHRPSEIRCWSAPSSFLHQPSLLQQETPTPVSTCSYSHYHQTFHHGWLPSRGTTCWQCNELLKRMQLKSFSNCVQCYSPLMRVNQPVNEVMLTVQMTELGSSSMSTKLLTFRKHPVKSSTGNFLFFFYPKLFFPWTQCGLCRKSILLPRKIAFFTDNSHSWLVNI